jgi:4-diphosphocytidyl-2-C-methyl-D-erythritol kinase
LAVRAAEAALRELGLRRQVFISLDKRIPPGSGLGGASSDAAAVLRALVHLSGKKLPFHRLVHLAAGLGSDVPFFLLGGRALGLGRGEEVYPLSEAPRQTVVVLFPGQGMNTAEAYRLLRAPRLTAVHARPTIELFCGGTMEKGAPLANDFEQVVFRRFPQLAVAKRFLLRSGATVASLSGSGSALYGLFADHAKARSAARQVGKSGSRVFLARTVSRREFHAQIPFAQRSR